MDKIKDATKYILYIFFSFILLLSLSEFFLKVSKSYISLKKINNKAYIQKPLPEYIKNNYNHQLFNDLNLPTPHKNDKLNYSLKYDHEKIIQYPKLALNHYKPNSIVHSKVSLKPSGKIIYDTTYSIDNVGRRKVVNRKRNTDNYLLILGGSNTWGDGVSDKKIIPYYLQEHLNNHEVYIAAKPGFGPNDILYSIENDSFLFKDIKQKKGSAVFLFISDHPNRASPSLAALVNSYLLDKPEYIFKNDLAVFNGYFKDRLKYKAYALLAQSELLKLFNFNLPLNQKQLASDNFIKLLLSIEKKLAQKYNLQNLYIISLFTGAKDSSGYLIKKKWNELNRTFYDVGEYNFRKITNKQDSFPLDRHKTAPVHWIKAQLIIDILKELNIN